MTWSRCPSPFKMLEQNAAGWTACKQPRFIAYRSGGWKAKVRGPPRSPSAEGSLPGQEPALLTVSTRGRRGVGSPGPLLRGHRSHSWELHPWPKLLPKATSYYRRFGARPSARRWAHVQVIALCGENPEGSTHVGWVQQCCRILALPRKFHCISIHYQLKSQNETEALPFIT